MTPLGPSRADLGLQTGGAVWPARVPGWRTWLLACASCTSEPAASLAAISRAMSAKHIVPPEVSDEFTPRTWTPVSRTPAPPSRPWRAPQQRGHERGGRPARRLPGARSGCEQASRTLAPPTQAASGAYTSEGRTCEAVSCARRLASRCVWKQRRVEEHG